MKKKSFVLMFSFLFCFELSFSKEKVYHEIYPSPLLIKTRIKSIFGELRGTHFHSGLDFSTYSKVGIPVRAIDDGEIYMFSRLLYGYGNVLYVKHRKFIAVYAHLQRFENKRTGLENFSKFVAKKYGDGRYILHYRLKKPIKIKKGQIIAYSGESGSGPPHLHFEIREKDDGAVNTFKYIKVKDTIPPSIGEIKIIPLKWYSLINNSTEEFTIKKNKIPKVEGPFIIKAFMWDRIDKFDKTGIYGLDVHLEKEIIVSVRFEKLKFLGKEEVGVSYDIDESSYIRDKFEYFVYPYFGEEMRKFYLPWEDVFSQLKAGIHSIKIVAYDYWGNRASTVFRFKYIKPAILVDKTVKINDFTWEIKLKNSISPIKSYSINFIGENYKFKSTPNGNSIYLQLMSKKIKHPLYLKLILNSNFQIIKLNNNKPSIEECYKKFKIIGIDIAKISNCYEKNSRATKKFFISPIYREVKNYILLNNDEQLISGNDFYIRIYKNSLFYKRAIKIENETNYKTLKGFIKVSKDLKLSPENYVLKKKAEIGFKLKNNFNKDKAGIYFYKKDKAKWVYLKTSFKNSHIISKIWRFGTYAVIVDNEKPKIYPIYPKSGRKYRRLYNLKAKVIEEGKGLNYKKLYFVLNGKKFWAYYDPDKKLIYYPLKKLKKGKYELKIIAEDYAKNRSIKTVIFHII